MDRTISEKFACSCGGPLAITAILPYTGFVPGQKIPITLQCDNATRRSMTSLEIRLWRVSINRDVYPWNLYNDNGYSLLLAFFLPIEEMTLPGLTNLKYPRFRHSIQA